MRRRIIIAVMVVLLLGITVATILSMTSRRGMPVYQGRTAQQWLGEILTTNQAQAYKAFGKMGTNALPVILRAFEKKDSTWDRFYQRNYPKLPAFLRNRLSRPLTEEERWTAARLAAVIVSYSNDSKAAAQDFARLLADGNSARQWHVIQVLFNLIGPNDTNCVPPLIKGLQSSNVLVSADSAQLLERIGPGARAAVPDLVAILDGRAPAAKVQNAPFALRMNAAEALWRIDHQTNMPARVFREALTNTDTFTRYSALSCLGEIQPDDVSLIPPLLELLHNTNRGWQAAAAAMILRYGSAAKAAVPDLVKLADSSDLSVRDIARQSLKMIDPEVAREFENK